MATLIPNCAASSKFDIGFSFIGKSINERFYLILEYFKKSPEVFKMWLGPFLIVGVSNPKHMEAVINNTNSLEKGALLDYAKPFLGNGLLSATDIKMIGKLMEREFYTFRVLLTLAIAACALLIVKFYWKRRHLYKLAALIPNYGSSRKYDLGLSFLGKSIDESFKCCIEYFKISPSICKIWLGPYLIVAVSQPEHMEIVLNHTNSTNKGPLIDFIKKYMGDGLVSAPVDIWRRHRKLINPTFNQKRLNSFIPIFAEKCDILIEVLEEAVGKPDIDITKMLSACTLDTICETAMGLKIDAQTTSNHYGELLEREMEIVTNRIFNIFYHSELIFSMTKLGKESTGVVKELNDLSETVIKKQREIFEQKMRGDYIENEVADGEHIKTFLEILLEISQNGDHFTNQELRDEVNTFIAAGSDTTSVTMSFCCLTLGMFPEYQEKVYKEAFEVLGQDRCATKNDLPKLQFLEMFIKETLRIFPITPLLLRVTTGELKIGDYVIPDNSTIAMGIINLHRNPKYWDDPLKFNPYRFLPEETAKRHSYSFMAFSGGPRGCIGSRYAMMVMKVILSKIVRKFRIKTDYKSVEDVELKINLMMRPSQGFKLTLEHRE